MKSRTLAAKLVADGHVRVNGARIATPARAVGAGDVLTIALERQVKVLRVLAPGARRGPFVEARLLYDDLSPQSEAAPAAGPGAAGGERPTKRDRRAVDRLLRSEHE